MKATEMKLAYCLAANQHHAVKTMAVDWFWQKLPGGYFQGPPGAQVKPISTFQALETIQPGAMVFLGYEWFRVRDARRIVAYYSKVKRNCFIDGDDISYIAHLHKALRQETDAAVKALGEGDRWSDEQIKQYLADWPCWLEQRETGRDAVAHIREDMSRWGD